MEEELEISEETLNAFTVELEEEAPVAEVEREYVKTTKKNKKPKTNDSKNEKYREKKVKKPKPTKIKEKLTMIKKKKSFVKAKANNNVVVVNCDSGNEGEYICYPEASTVIKEEVNYDSEDPLLDEQNYNAFMDELYIGNEQENPVEEDERVVENFLRQNCCQRQCNTKFRNEELLRYRLELQCLDYSENGVNQLDLVLLGLIHSLCRISNEIRHSRIVEEKDRRRIKLMFGFRGVSVCRAMFMFAHCIKIERLKRLIKHYKENGVSPKAHGNYKRVPVNAISVEQIRDVVTFLKRYADENAAVVSGRSGQQNQDIKILPPHETKLRVFNKYKETCEEQNISCISVVTFRRLWNRFCPNILIQIGVDLELI